MGGVEQLPGAREREVAAAWGELVATARRTVADGLVVGTSGTSPSGLGDTVLVTPTGVPYDGPGPKTPSVWTSRAGRSSVRSLPDERTADAPRDPPRHRRGPSSTPTPRTRRPSAPSTQLPRLHDMAGALGHWSQSPPMRPTAPRSWPSTPRPSLAASACLLQNHGTIADQPRCPRRSFRTAQLEWMSRVWLLASSVPWPVPDAARGTGGRGGGAAGALWAGRCGAPLIDTAYRLAVRWHRTWGCDATGPGGVVALDPAVRVVPTPAIGARAAPEDEPAHPEGGRPPPAPAGRPGAAPGD